MKPLIIQTEAKLELAEAIAWYNEQRPKLGLDLLAGVERAFDRLRRYPERCSPHEHGFRKLSVPGFPYRVFFMEEPDAIWVAAVAHNRRRPNYWMERRRTAE